MSRRRIVGKAWKAEKEGGWDSLEKKYLWAALALFAIITISFSFATSQTFSIDYTNPELTHNNTYNGIWVNFSYSVLVNATDNISGIQFFRECQTAGGGTCNAVAGSNISSPHIHVHNLVANFVVNETWNHTVYDFANNTNETAYTVLIDAQDPVTTNNFTIPNGTVLAGPQNITFSCTDANGSGCDTLFLCVTNATGSCTPTPNVTIAVATSVLIGCPGTPSCRLRVFYHSNDTAGNAEDTKATNSIAINNSAPTTPTGLDTPPNNSLLNNPLVYFNWNDSTDADDDTIFYHIQVDNNSNFSSPELNSSGFTTSNATLLIPADGTWFWRVRAFDNFNAFSPFAHPTFTLDTTPPVCTIDPPLPSSTSSAAVAVAGYCSDATSGVVQVAINGLVVATTGPPSNVSFNATVPLISGFNIINVTAKDLANNSGSTLANITSTFVGGVNDTVGPAVVLISPENGGIVSTGNVTLVYQPVEQVSNLSNCTLILNGAVNQTLASPPVVNSGENNFTVVISTEGANTWSISCFDSAGNQGNSSTRVFFVNAPPQNPSTLNIAGFPTDTDGVVFLNWPASPSPDVAQYRIYRSTLANFTPLGGLLIGNTSALNFTDIVPSDTTWYYRVTAVDNLSSENLTSPPQNFTLVDTGKPNVESITVVYPTAAINPNVNQTRAKNGDNITIVVSVNDPQGVVEVRVNATPINATLPTEFVQLELISGNATEGVWRTSIQVGGLTGDADRTLQLFANDSSGNVRGPLSLTVQIDNTAPLLTVTDDGSFTSTTTYLHATFAYSDSDSAALGFVYFIFDNLGNVVVNKTFTTNTDVIQVVSPPLEEGKTYTWSVTAHDGANNSVTNFTNGITVDTTPPTFVFVTDEGDTFVDSDIFASWFATDPESGILRYFYRIGEDANADNIVDNFFVFYTNESVWKNGTVGANTTGFVNTNLTANATAPIASPVDGRKYFFQVKAENSAGVSAFALSDGITKSNSTVINSTVTNCPVSNSTIVNSTLINCTVQNSNITGSVKVNSTIINSTIVNSTNINSTIINSNETASNITNSTVIGSDVTNSIKIGSTNTNCNIINSVEINTNCQDSTKTGSTDTNSNITNSTITGSNITNSLVQNSTVIGSTKINSTIINSTIINSTNNNVTIVNGVEIGSTIADSSISNSTITNSTLASVRTEGANITNNVIFSGFIECLATGANYTAPPPTNISDICAAAPPPPPPPVPSPPAPLPGAGGAMQVPQISEKVRFPFIAGGDCKTVQVQNFENLSIKEIELCVSSAVRNVEVTISLVLSMTGAIPPVGPTYKTLMISAERVRPNQIASVKFTYTVSNAWIMSNDIDASRIKMQRLTTAWTPLPTEFIAEDALYRTYSSVSPGFSLFTITGPALVCPVCPEPGLWSTCENNLQNRTEYACSRLTGYKCEPRLAVKICGPEVFCPVCPPDKLGSCIEGKRIRTTYTCGPETGYVCQPFDVEQSCPFVALPQITPEQLDFLIKAILILAGLVIFAILLSLLNIYLTKRKRAKVVEIKKVYARPMPSIWKALVKRIEGPRVIVRKVYTKPKEKKVSLWDRLLRSKPKKAEVPVPTSIREKKPAEKEAEHIITEPPRIVKPVCEICGRPQTLIHTCDVCGREVCIDHAEVVGNRLLCIDHAAKQK